MKINKLTEKISTITMPANVTKRVAKVARKFLAAYDKTDASFFAADLLTEAMKNPGGLPFMLSWEFAESRALLALDKIAKAVEATEHSNNMGILLKLSIGMKKL